MARIVAVLVTVLVVSLTPRAFGASCSLSTSELQTKRAGYDATCTAMTQGCATAKNHGQYVSCIAHQAKADTTLPNECRGAVVKCAAKSTCGKSGFVTCCRTKADGTTKCSTKKGASACTAPKGGHACVGLPTHPSCCDACTATGCASPSGAFIGLAF